MKQSKFLKPHSQLTLKAAIEPLEFRAYFSSVSFSAPVNTDTTGLGVTPVAADIADLNGDGKADLIVANSSDSISVLLSNGDGTFANPATIAINGQPTSITTGYFDTTGNLDIAVGTTGSPGSVSIIVGNGNGTFLPSNDIAALDNNQSIVLGDFNNDGKTDILSISSSAAPSGNAMLLLGNGTAGAFSQAPFSLPYGSVSAVAVGDFDGDGNLDFAVADSLNSSVSVFLGSGNGTFLSPVTYATGAGPSSIIVSDINGKTLSNGKPELDIITANAQAGTVSYLANDGDGTFAAPVNSTVVNATGTGPASISVADFNSDGRPDLLAVMGSGSNNAVALVGNGDGTFTASGDLNSGVGTATSGASGDISGDGYADAVLTTATGISSFVNTYTVGATASTTGLVVASSTVTAGQSNQFTATVSPSSVTGSVNFLANNVSIGTANLVNGTATLSTSVNTPGNVAITAVYSGDPTFSASVSNTAQVTVNAVMVAPKTLLPSVLSDNLAAALVTRTTYHGSARIKITNSSSATIKGLAVLNVFASGDITLDDDSVNIGSAKLKVSIKPGASITVGVPLKITAGLLSQGNYKLVAQTVDPTKNLTTADSATSFVLADPFVQLTQVFSKLVLPSIAVKGDKTTAVALIKITNSGNVTSKGETPVSIYASQDGTVGNGSLLNTVRPKLSIPVGKSVTVAVPLKNYAVSNSGEYSIVAQVTDPTGGISTTVSNSTIDLESPTIDLAGGIDALPAKAKIGSSMLVTIDVTNNGNVVAKGPLQIAFSSSTAADGSTPFAPLHRKSKNQSETRQQNAPAAECESSNRRDGCANYLVATLDPTNTFADPNLIDNTSVSAVTVKFG